ncbi:helix-turn-helix transcriptional regulator [Clostridium gasigenes]|uniref:AraC family transcriptional regulator n=1 Tax=Clostridium gasigenes TaxID=94869 RepID=UPI0014382A43|nr:AraC family transcriptional regulator [Clostridium gasigenes]NKF06510.1 AraC family transcriptional regulator [Clostridium gasigenes]QSW21131.1 helix-turn-helix transcriptional regulator [Clostridium gasigenes]
MSNTRYLIDYKNMLNVNYELLYISKSKFENDWHSTAHFHPFTEIFFITSGRGSFHLDAKIVNVSEGDLIIINPNCLHTEKSTFFKEPLEYIVLGVDNLLLSFSETKILIQDNDSVKLYTILNYADKNIILQYLNPLIYEITTKEYNYDIACKSLLILLIITILRGIKNNIIIQDEPQKKLNLECMKIKNYIDSHYSEDITLDFLAGLTYINKFHLVHSFTKQVGLSPINYVINRRIEESKNLLKTTNYSVRDITTIVGFSNSSYFSQTFKKMTGESPRSYRLK